MEITLEKLRPTLAEKKKIKLAAEVEARKTIIEPPVRQLTREEILAEENRSSDEESEWAAFDFWRKREQIHEEKMAAAAATASSSKKGKRDIYNEYDARGEFEELIEEIMRERRAGTWTSDEKTEAEFRKKRLAEFKRELSDERSNDYRKYYLSVYGEGSKESLNQRMEKMKMEDDHQSCLLVKKPTIAWRETLASISEENPTYNLVDSIMTEKSTTNLAAP